MLYVFDVDGVICKSRERMTNVMQKNFREWGRGKYFIFVTGSDYDKIASQIPYDIRITASKIFTCLGNETWVGETLIKFSTFRFPGKLYSYLEKLIERSEYSYKYNNHIETRTGALNFSTVGRNASTMQRLDYFYWDVKNNERKQLITELSREFPEYDFSLGGQISIDINPKGKNKGQIYPELKEYGMPIIFYGDRCYPGGNDYPLACLLSPPDKFVNVVYNEDFLEC